jgi:hypothetical protein
LPPSQQPANGRQRGSAFVLGQLLSRPLTLDKSSKIADFDALERAVAIHGL